MSKGKMGNRIKLAWLKSMEVLGTSASNLADNAKTKVNELNYESRRREILTEFSLKAFELWQKGVELPEPLSDMCQELSELDEKLNVLRAQKYAKLDADGNPAPEAEEAPQDDDAQASEPEGQDPQALPEQPAETEQPIEAEQPQAAEGYEGQSEQGNNDQQ